MNSFVRNFIFMVKSADCTSAIEMSTRYRKIAGGLDNAVTQAEQTGLHNWFVFDADCHFMELFKSLTDYCTEPFRELLLRPDPEADPWLAQRSEPWGKEPEPTFRMRSVNFIKRESNYPKPMSEDEIVDLFTRRMHDIGIKKSLVLPTAMLSLPKANPGLELAVARSYIDFMLDKFLSKYSQIFTLVYAPTNSPERAAELIANVGSENGIAGVMISGSSKALAGDVRWDSIFEVAENNRLPVCFHGDRETGGNYEGLEFVGAHALSFPFSLIRQLASLVLAGVPDKFPNLKFVFMEGGVTWMPWLIQRLDDEYTKRRLEAPLLTKLPSEYIKEFYYTRQPLEQSHTDLLEPIFELMDLENHLLYASDYPHWDFDVPSVIYDLPFLSEEAKMKILGKNATSVFKI